MVTPEEANQLVTKAFALVRACPSGRVTTYSWLGSQYHTILHLD